MNNWKENLKYHLAHIPGWRTNRRIVVIESDDWGSTRMPSKKIYETLIQKGIRVDQLAYNKFDALASESDLASLFDVLCSVKDKNGHHAKLTANTIVANPDFEKIKESGYLSYHFEPFVETLKKYPNHSGSFELWKQGMDSNIFRPQFHGREHLNAKRWMKALQHNVGHVRLAFDLGMYDLSTGMRKTENSFMDALDFDDITELDFQKEYLIEGLQMFEDIFGFRSSTFIAPCYIWSNELNQTLFNLGVKAFQGSWYQLEPIIKGEKKLVKRFHYTGQMNNFGQYYLARNVVFEPSEIKDQNWVNEVLSKLAIAFRNKKPAIIQSHRLNFIGYIDQNNRKKNLELFASVLKSIVKKWPDVEFFSSDELVDVISK